MTGRITVQPRPTYTYTTVAAVSVDCSQSGMRRLETDKHAVPARTMIILLPRATRESVHLTEKTQM